ncbi:XRRA1 protein, partial [Chordeiles acutipennis]|nr:XRRA1 protein [Chordeiles acutipennis]
MSMMGLSKMGDGSNYATKCFPARNILCASKKGDISSSAAAEVSLQNRSGRWVLAHRATPKAWTEKRTTKKTPQQRKKPPESTSMEENNEVNVLDEPFLVSADFFCYCLIFLIALREPGENLLAKEDDFEKFDCVAFINAAENLLTLEPFRKFPGLRELELSLNRLRNLKITAGDFLHLEDLDLSYNNLSPQDIWKLGDLSHLKVLRLTANGLRSLPPDLAGSWDVLLMSFFFCIHSSAHLRFPSLEVLWLDDNHLSDPSVFVSLAHLCSLRELNLDRNRISAVPYLHQAENRQFFLHPALDGDSFRAKWYKSLSSLWQQPRPTRQEDTEVAAELEVKKGQLEYLMPQNSRDPDRTGEQHLPLPAHTETVGESSGPALVGRMKMKLSSLWCDSEQTVLYFTLQIAEETALLPVAFFPCLKELTFNNNPLTTTRSGQPPLLTQLLQHNLGIKLVRQKSLAVERWHFSIPLKASRKV